MRALDMFFACTFPLGPLLSYAACEWMEGVRRDVSRGLVTGPENGPENVGMGKVKRGMLA